MQASADNGIKFKYLDASALVKLYVDEGDFQPLRDFFKKNTYFRTTWLCLAEALGVLKHKRDNREVGIDKYIEATCSLIINWRMRIESDDLELVDASVPLKVERMAKKYNLDYSDALQLITIKSGKYSRFVYESAPNIYEPALVLITADEELASAAASEGIRVWNCTAGPAPAWAY